MVNISVEINIDGLKNLENLNEKSIYEMWEPAVKKFYSEVVYSTNGREIGESWDKRKQPTGNWALLRKTGKMQKSSKTKIEQNGLVFYYPEGSYAKYHQTVTRKMVARPIVGESKKLNNTLVQMVNQKIERWIR